MRALIELPLLRVAELLYGPAISRTLSGREPMTIKGSLPYWAILAILAVSGLLAIAIPDIWGWHWDRGITRDIGVTLLISSALGFTIDRWLKTEIAADVFRAAFGYAMPSEFQAEIQRMLSFKFICDSHEMWYDVKTLDNGFVLVNVRIERKIRNITNAPEPQRGYIGIDDWEVPGAHSSIQRCEIIVGTTTKSYEKIETEDNPPRLKAITKDIIIPAGGTATMVTAFSEIRRENDHVVSVFLTPTKNPRFHVKADNFNYQLDFGVTDANYHKSPVSDTYTLDGVYFPPGNIRLRWWPKHQPDLLTLDQSLRPK